MDSAALNAGDQNHTANLLFLFVKNNILRNWQKFLTAAFVVFLVMSAIDVEELPINEDLKPLMKHIPTLQNIYQQLFPEKNLSKYYEAKDIREAFDFQLTGDATLTDLDLTFLGVNQGIKCQLWENIEKNGLLEVIESLGKSNKFSKDEVDQMKLAALSDYHVDAIETFQHGLHGHFRY